MSQSAVSTHSRTVRKAFIQVVIPAQVDPCSRFVGWRSHPFFFDMASSTKCCSPGRTFSGGQLVFRDEDDGFFKEANTLRR